MKTTPSEKPQLPPMLTNALNHLELAAQDMLEARRENQRRLDQAMERMREGFNLGDACAYAGTMGASDALDAARKKLEERSDDLVFQWLQFKGAQPGAVR